jgi:hypothetical protein
VLVLGRLLLRLLDEDREVGFRLLVVKSKSYYMDFSGIKCTCMNISWSTRTQTRNLTHITLLGVADHSFAPDLCRLCSRHGQLSSLVQVMLLIGMESVFLVMRVMSDGEIRHWNRKETINQ